ncbi:MAG TPA: urea amidolyase family protein [Streptosporangiaceae bacterium]|nr:urea amidolyase family protein [Streptosporangiaceae bacterium]
MIRVRSAGDAALLLEAPATHQDGNGAAAIAALIRSADLPGVTDVVPGAATVLVAVDPGSWDTSALAARLTALVDDHSLRGAADLAGRSDIEIEVCYDGPDLADVAALTVLSVADVIARHQAAQYRVGWLGFAPGFAYLTGLDPLLATVPRLDSPRLRVPAGSVAIAGGLAAVYPATSPGGWRLLGRTAAPLWQADRDPPTLLAPGTRVRFRAVDSLPAAPSRQRREADPIAAARRAEVLQPGPLATVQDLGRAGLAHLGVPGSGAADTASLRLANDLVGNEADAACVEVTLGRLAMRFDCDAVVAVTGASTPIRVSSVAGDREVSASTAFTVPAGSVVRLGAPTTGLRSYVGIAGGIGVRPVLGSRSTDCLSGLGPSPLRTGEWLPLNRRRSGPEETRALRPRAADPAGSAAGPVELRVIAGPRDDWFTAAALGGLANGTYVVSPASNRTGLRLTGPELRRKRPGELPSEGVATGSLQVTHDGQPILLLADHPTTGGYPVIAVVAAADIGRAAQLRPGQQIRFRVSRGLALPAPPSAG